MPVGSAGVRAAAGSQKVANQSQNRNEMFMALVCRLLLHGLSMHQSDLALGKLFSGARVVLRRFGARLFISSCGDTLQDWLRCTVQHCNARRPRLRQSAGDFLLYLMRSTFHFTGSITQVTQPLLGVYTTSLFETVQANMSLVRTTEDYERVLMPLRETLRMIAEGHGSTNAAFNDTARQLAIDLAWILDATIQTHQYLPDPAKYFYDGTNGLEAPSEAVSIDLFGAVTPALFVRACSHCVCVCEHRCVMSRARARRPSLARCAWEMRRSFPRTPRACSGRCARR